MWSGIRSALHIRSRVSFFMYRSCKLGFIDYNVDHVQAHRSLLNVVLQDQLPGEITEEESASEFHKRLKNFAN